MPALPLSESQPLLDGPARVTGALRFAPDLHIPGMLHARFVSSPYAHANIRGIKMDAALSTPGVVAVLTADDLPFVTPDTRVRLLLARDRVIFSGQPVALVLATTEACAQDGAERVQVDYEPLPAAVTAEEAMAADAPLVWPRVQAAAITAPAGTDELSAETARTSSTISTIGAVMLTPVCTGGHRDRKRSRPRRFLSCVRLTQRLFNRIR
jgi:CO/xanthine dehydrogenase Mo-binding subunit